MAALVNDKTSNVQQVKDFTENLIKRIRELEQITANQINSKHKEWSDDAGTDMTYLDAMISVMEEDLTSLDQSRQYSESTVFVNTRLGQRHVVEGRQILQQVGEHHKTSPGFVLTTNVKHFLNYLTTLGNFPDDRKVYKAKLKGEYNINAEHDDEICDSPGSYLLSDGTVIVTDWINQRLKCLNASYSVTDHCDMPHGPLGVTCTAPDEVAVTLTHMKKVQFVSVRGSMSMTRSFRTSDICRGNHLSHEELFVSCGGLKLKDWEEGPGHVAVYNLNGTLLRTIQTDQSGQDIFSSPCHITTSPDGARIYVTHRECGVVSSDRSGKRFSSLTVLSLNYVWRLCTLDNGNILLCGRDSDNVLQFDNEGRKLTTLLKYTDGIKKPTSLCCDSVNSRLIVTMETIDNIKVFYLA